MKNITRFSLLVVTAFLTLAGPASAQDNDSAPLTEAQTQFLASYETVHTALAADNLPAAQQAAAKISNNAAQQIAKAPNLKAARNAFKSLSKEAVELAHGQRGYYVAHCPMVPKNEGNWVQTDKQITNPYYGSMMLRCGSIKTQVCSSK